MEQQIRTAGFDMKSLIKIGRTGRIKRDKGPVGAVDMGAGCASRGGIRCSQHVGREGSGQLVLGADIRKTARKRMTGVNKGFHPYGVEPTATERKIRRVGLRDDFRTNQNFTLDKHNQIGYVAQHPARLVNGTSDNALALRRG